MPAKSKAKKTAAPKRKVVRYKSKINLLKNLNVILLVTGFVVSLFTVFLLSSRSDNYDVRSRGQVTDPSGVPSSMPSIALPSGGAGVPSAVCLGGVCPSAAPNQNDEENNDGNDDQGKGKINNPNQQPDEDNEDPEEDQDGNQNPDDNDEGDSNKGHGNDEDGVDEDNPGQGNGGPNAEKNAPDNENVGGLFEQLMALITQLIRLLTGGGANPQQ